jgi:hypothetical protein
VAHSADLSPAAEQDRPGLWLGRTRLLDLEDPKLRLRVQALTQLCKNEREKAVALYRFVKRLPIAKRFKFGLSTARKVMEAGRGDADEKAALLVAMLRIANIPARLRYVTMRGEILRGVISGVTQADRPVLEVWLPGGWQQTDTYIHDASTMAAARQRLKDLGWEWGYGIHVEGRILWDGHESAFAGGVPDAENPMVVREVGLFHDPYDHLVSSAFRRRHTPWLRLLRWNMLAPMMDRAWRRLREETASPRAPSRRPS